LDGAEWEAVREDVLAGLSLEVPVEEHLAELVRANGGFAGRDRGGAVLSREAVASC
jgi:hypothetical protein